MRKHDYEAMFAEEDRHWWYAGMREIVLSLLPPDGTKPIRILDAGCGTGYNLGWLERHYGGRVTGLDYIPHALPYCRARRRVDLVQGSVADLPFADRSFGIVACLDVLTQLESQSARRRAVREIFRVLVPGGAALIRVAANEWLRSSHDEELQTFHRFGGRELREGMRIAGFEVVRCTFANTFLFPVAVLWRMLKRLRIAPAGSDVSPTTRGPDWLNDSLRTLLSLESVFLRAQDRSFPFGLSIVAVARRPTGCYTSGRS